jgi:hypothetical protein
MVLGVGVLAPHCGACAPHWRLTANLRPSATFKDTTMSTSEAERFGRRAGHSTDVKELADNVWRAVDALSKAIKDLESRVRRLEAQR